MCQNSNQTMDMDKPEQGYWAGRTFEDHHKQSHPRLIMMFTPGPLIRPISLSGHTGG